MQSPYAYLRALRRPSREVMTLDGAHPQGLLLTTACVPRLKELNRNRVDDQREWGPLDFD